MKATKSESMIRVMVRGVYDQQQLRIQMGNRIVANFKAKIGQQPGMSETALDKAEKTLLAKLRASYDKITSGVVDKLPRQASFKGDELISEYAELVLVNQYVQMEKSEDTNFAQLKYELENHRIYTDWLAGIEGIGPALAAVIISEIDIHKAEYPSSLWKYAGLDVVTVYKDADGNRYSDSAVAPKGDGTYWSTCRKAGATLGKVVEVFQVTEGRGRREEHLVKREYIDKEGAPSLRNSITFSPFLKTKLVGVAGSSFLKTMRVFIDGVRVSTKDRLFMAKALGFEVPEQEQDEADDLYSMRVRDAVLDFFRSCGKEVVVKKSPYAVAYDNYKTRLANDPRHKDKTRSHRHNMAVRFMVKRFLVDLYREWRRLEGLPIAAEYSEAKLGLVHGQVSDGKKVA